MLSFYVFVYKNTLTNKYSCNCTVSHKEAPCCCPLHCPYLRQRSADFKNSCTVTLYMEICKFASEWANKDVLKLLKMSWIYTKMYSVSFLAHRICR